MVNQVLQWAYINGVSQHIYTAFIAAGFLAAFFYVMITTKRFNIPLHKSFFTYFSHYPLLLYYVCDSLV